MQRRQLFVYLFWLAVGAPSASLAEGSDFGVIIMPNEEAWRENKTVPSGMLMFIMSGAPNHPGPFTFRAQIPPNYKLPPHRHPDTRTVTVLKGTYYSGVGEVFDEKRLIAFPAGSYYTTPGNTPHFAATKEEGVLIQESGEGPNSGINYVDPADDPRKK